MRLRDLQVGSVEVRNGLERSGSRILLTCRRRRRAHVVPTVITQVEQSGGDRLGPPLFSDPLVVEHLVPRDLAARVRGRDHERGRMDEHAVPLRMVAQDGVRGPLRAVKGVPEVDEVEVEPVVQRDRHDFFRQGHGSVQERIDDPTQGYDR